MFTKVCVAHINHLEISWFLHYLFAVWSHIFTGCSQWGKVTFLILRNVSCAFNTSALDVRLMDMSTVQILCHLSKRVWHHVPVGGLPPDAVNSPHQCLHFQPPPPPPPPAENTHSRLTADWNPLPPTVSGSFLYTDNTMEMDIADSLSVYILCTFCLCWSHTLFCVWYLTGVRPWQLYMDYRPI